ncbi:hypothetical protein SCP_0312940 [Sparassis crispa]|uniref:SEC7 domain-containing protein n=1 Tax=Sparassis crispa TaxID=139825 RepID=A0A401GHI0_9APHY|nr:hypothetical protein SCP_0312940 [Sparassis crispa]GBE81565.1 hypothetical protein SCP_0312940 [Sparassis crispa]
MDLSSVAEQRATAVAKLKRAASLPRMKDGRRPPMHVEAVSEGERVQNDDRKDDESAQESDGRPEPLIATVVLQTQAEAEAVNGVKIEAAAKTEEAEFPSPETPVVAESMPVRAKRRSRSRTRSRGSKDLKGKAKQSPHVSSASHTNESSADEYYTTQGEDAPPSPPLVSPIPSHFGFSAARLLSSPLFYPGTSPSTPLPSLDELQKGIGMGLYRSNSAGAARAMAMQKLTGGKEPMDISFIPSSPTPSGGRLTRNNTFAGGERMAARRLMLHRLGNRIKEADGDQTSGGEEAAPPTLPPKRRRRRSKRNSSRASTVVDDREEREPPSTTSPTPVLPPSPLPPPMDDIPDPPHLPSPMNRVGNGDAVLASPFMKANGNISFDYATPMGHRGVVVEDEDDLPEHVSPVRHSNLPTTPARSYGGTRLPHTSDAPSNTSTDSASASAIGVPVFLSRSAALRQDMMFPASPFATPLREKPYLDEDEEQVLYEEVGSLSRERESEISWIAEPVPERMPLRDDEEDDDDIPEPEPEEEVLQEPPPEPSEGRLSREYERVPPRPSVSQDLVVELETSPETTPSHIPPSPASPIALLGPTISESPTGAEASPAMYPMRLSVATTNPVERSPSTAEFPEPDWDENSRATVTDATIKRAADTSTSTWEKVKNTFSRSGSASNRRSRTNSIGIRDRRNNTDSSVSRESGASLKGDKTDGSGPLSPQGQSLVVHSPSASMLSLPSPPPPVSISPLPPASPFDMMKYADSKLFPFPGMKQLEEQRNRAKGLSQSSSSPDVVLPNGTGIEAVPSSSSSSTATRFPDTNRERKLSHQASDTRLLAQFRTVASPPPVSSVPSSASQADYFTTQSQTSTTSVAGSLKLPMNREGVKKWLTAKKLFSPSVPSTPNVHAPPPVAETRPGLAGKKPSLSDLLLGRKENELATEWEDLGAGRLGRSPKESSIEVRMETDVRTSHDHATEQAPSSRMDSDIHVGNHHAPSPSQTFEVLPPDPPSSTTPDPQSSLDDFPTQSTSESFCDTLSSSHHSPDPPAKEPGEAAIIMDRLDEMLERGSKNSFWPTVIDDPPRKLIQCSPVLQVANANTVKDRFLFLFNDILVIAKPVLQDQDAMLDTLKPSPSDKKYIVKSVVRLSELRFSGDRDESGSKAPSHATPMKHSVIRSFVHQFAKDPDHAIATLFSKAETRDDPVALGQLLFHTLELDRARLGEYLSRRTSKVVLKAYVDSFGLTGLRIDKALRVFLLAISIPPKLSALEHLLDAFASRWYEANVGVVAYDKELAIRLVRAIVQLNEVMHSGIAQEPGITGYPRRNIITRDFVEAFRRFDPRYLVSDDLLDKIYASIRREKLSQARHPSSQSIHPDILITIKRPLPPRLTYRVQSDPVILRIPQVDPQLTIQLFGQDLAFDPPVLTFAKSAEASFRVTGTSLGSKTVIMWRSGPTALAYSGFPLSSPLVVERAFMRNTFQLAFVNHNGAKRKYMFSVDDHLVRHHWTVSLKQQIESASSPAPSTDIPGTSSKAQKINENLAFKVLQETLIGTDGHEHPSEPISPVDEALARLTGTSPQHHPNESASSDRAAGDLPVASSSRKRANGSSVHVRSKSRSQVYHRHGPGKLESELNDSAGDDDYKGFAGSSQQLRPEGRLWRGRDLELVCRQNSLIPSILAYLQVGRIDHDGANGVLS